MKTYPEVLDYLYTRLPIFTRDGASAYKKDLDRTLTLCKAIGNPQDTFKTIHVAGTNGKGSSSHMLAAILASAGYKTGLYTSPHLVDFRERIRVNGEWIDAQFVMDYVNTQKDLIEDIQPSFFEVTVAMAFDYFAKQEVDIAIVEVGLGGRLDSTNIIHPEVSLITNIGMDHMNILGNTLEEIAQEKAGIIKQDTPVVISETHPSTEPIFKKTAHTLNAPIVFADQQYRLEVIERTAEQQRLEICAIEGACGEFTLDLTGSYQCKNILGVLAVVDILQEKGWVLPGSFVTEALAHVKRLTGLQGRWQVLSTDPLMICDTGHNEDGIKEVVRNLAYVSHQKLHIVIGAMKDKDLDHMLPYLPKDAAYYFASPNTPRAMDAEELAAKAEGYGLKGQICDSVAEAVNVATSKYSPGDLIFIGGSNFVVAEVLGK